MNLQFDLRQLGRHGRASATEDAHIDRTFEPPALDVRDDDYRVAAPVRLVMDVRKDRDAYRVTGRVETRIELECGRCLEPFEIPVESAFELRYVPAATDSGEGEREVEEDDLTTAYYRDETLDLADLMREQLQLALPMKPLCNDSCKGLCPVCGTNLNLTTCACAPTWEDPRLAALKGLIDHKKE